MNNGEGISVVIPTWNGLHLLREHLPSVLRAVQCYVEATGAEAEILVVDDGSSDETTTALPGEFPDVQLIKRESNGGFAVACNSGFERCRYPLVALLNNDVLVRQDYLIHMASHFRSPEVFAVTAKVFEEDPPVFATGGKYGRFRRGFWSAYFNYDCGENSADIEEPLLSFYAVGGFATFDRQKLTELGGFLEILSPFHWEDIDLSYRAWKRGWDVHFEPRSLAHHKTSATINAHYESRQVETASLRNRLLFHWINLHSREFLLAHLAMLGVLVLTRFIVGDWGFYAGLSRAVVSLPEALRLRRVEKQLATRTDQNLVKTLSKFYSSRAVKVYYGRDEVLKEHPESPSVLQAKHERQLS